MTGQRLHPHLFLDFDGVLHPTSVVQGGLFSRVAMLDHALHGSECRIVISSSWRHHYPLNTLLDVFPKGLRQRVVGATGEARHGRWPRHQEILAYLQPWPLDVSWRALDDSWNEFPPSCPELIVCNPNRGLDTEQIAALIAWLGSPPST